MFRNTPPIQFTSFIGREDDVADLTRRLAGTRLLTLTGPGGVGKTRLAVEVARQTGDACFVELSPILDAALVPSAIATAAGLAEVQGESAVETLARALSSSRAIIVLDNCEHLVVGCAAAVEALLQACPSLTVLATSREPLNVGGEVVRRVPALSASDAAALFVERATAAEPGFIAGPENLGAIEQLCEKLDGLPLAIELAAAWLRVLSVSEIVARLSERLDLLSSRSPTVTGRHQTLRALVDWSYERLPAGEQRLYRRLSVFAGGCTLEAIEGICCEGETSEATSLSSSGEGRGVGEAQAVGARFIVPAAKAVLLPLLRSLIEKSLVIAEEADDETRYGMLETLRQHSREKLRESGEERELRRRHLEWFRGLAEEGERARLGPEQDRWHRRLERETENCRVALAWSRVDPAQQQTGLRLATAVGSAWHLSGHASEAFDWLTTLLDGAAPNATRARALSVAGYIAARCREPDTAQKLLDEALSLAQALDDSRHTVTILNAIAYLRLQRGDAQGALAAADEGLTLAQTTDIAPWRSRLLFMLGLAVARVGRPEEAVVHLREAVRLDREQQNVHWAGQALRALGNLLLELGQVTEARACLEASLASEKRRAEAVQSLACFVGLVAAEGDTAGAVRLAGAVSRLAEAWPDRFAPLPGQPLEQHLQIASDVLSPAARQAAWADGEAMSLDEAVDYALRRGLHATNPAVERPGGLTSRELEVAQLLAAGLTNRQIAATLVISQRTVHRHVENILGKLHLSSRGQVAVWVTELGQVRSPAG